MIPESLVAFQKETEKKKQWEFFMHLFIFTRVYLFLPVFIALSPYFSFVKTPYFHSNHCSVI